jgi:hypothetical protein
VFPKSPLTPDHSLVDGASAFDCVRTSALAAVNPSATMKSFFMGEF